MNSNEKHALNQLFDDYLRMYVAGDTALAERFSADFTGLACADGFLIKSHQDWLAVTRQHFTHAKELLGIELKELAIQPLADSAALITAVMSIHTTAEEQSLATDTVCLVLVLREESSSWKILHSSLSVANQRMNDSDASSLQVLKKRNHVLEQQVVEQTRQLSELTETLHNTHQQLTEVAEEFQQTEEALRKSRTDFRMLTENAADVVWRLDSEHRFTYISPADEKRRGYRADEVIGHHVFEMFDEEGIESIKRAAQQRQAAQQQGMRLTDVTFEARHRCKDGRWLWGEIRYNPEFDDSGNVIGFYGISREITERKQMQDQVHQLAFYDPLTALPNRHLLNERLSQTMAVSKRKGHHGAFMFLDLDSFKPINDTHGHSAGDLLLVEVAQRLKKCVRGVDTIARFGGDEFVVVLSELKTDEAQSIQQAQIIAEKIRTALAQTYRLSVSYDGKTRTEIEHSCTVSIGVALFFGQEVNLEELLKRADMSMYEAKESGRNTIRFYNPAQLN